jgi:predicted MPP superfamily phosphohydrolase
MARLGSRVVRAAAAAAGVASLAALSYARWIEPQRLVVRRVPVRLPRLPSAFHGYTILHLSDLHIQEAHGCDRLIRRHLAACASHAARERADLVVVTGDLVEDARYAEALAGWLRDIPARDGIYAVLGNHDHGCGWDPEARGWRKPHPGWRMMVGLLPFLFVPGGPHDVPRIVRSLEEADIALLLNRAVPIERKGQRLWLAGVDDPYQRRHSLTDALALVPPDDPGVLLAHAPEVLPDLDTSRPLLVLMGHTHGGQVRLPLLGAVTTRSAVPLPDACGLHRVGASQVYISRGLGATAPLRFLCPPEATIIRLLPEPALRRAAPAVGRAHRNGSAHASLPAASLDSSAVPLTRAETESGVR